jgi:hypothetical protein
VADRATGAPTLDDGAGVRRAFLAEDSAVSPALTSRSRNAAANPRGRRPGRRVATQRVAVTAQNGAAAFAPDAQPCAAYSATLATDADTPERARHMRSRGTVQRGSFTGDQPRLTTQAATGRVADTATGLATDAATESCTRTTTDAKLTKAGTTAKTRPEPMPGLTPAMPGLTPAMPESTPPWPELTPTRSATGTGFARTPTRPVPAETGLPTVPPRAPIPAVVLRHRRNDVRPVAVLVGQNLLQAADRVATEIHTRHGSRRRG